MADNDQLLQQIGKLIDTKLEAEREHTRKLVREEIEVEGTETRGEFNMKFLSVQTSLIDVKGKLKDVAIANTQTNTALEQNKTLLEALTAGQKEIQETMATKADVLTVGVKVDKLRKRIEGIEEQTGSSTHKN